ncbi:MAG: OsmC family protein [Geminicoccaceae bacterium]|nr:OsmC family protein [Geminicoccaceae bacterium]MCX7629589.1 OsmC family protein [Geminicoccaceae bacterium]MDW8125162.1 OsmC family protein [Geminicoccaceae bacterium]MDW8341982.1 OsmC family protein [Geminicoccaceae bacterium]
MASEAARVRVHPPHGTVVACESGRGPYALDIVAGRHRLSADEPIAAGGTDTGPNPYELLAAALAACTVMTVRMYARHKGLPVGAIRCAVKHAKIHAEDCAQCETKTGKIDRFERVIEIEGDLDEPTRQRLLEIANRCPVHRTLESEILIETRLEGSRGH